MILFMILLKGRKEVFVIQELNENRKKISSLDDDFQRVISLGNDSYMFSRNSIIYADLLGGLGIIIVMLFFAYMKDFDTFGLSDITSLILVFGVRFAIMYAGEFSRILNRLLQQRVIIEKISNPPF